MKTVVTKSAVKTGSRGAKQPQGVKPSHPSVKPRYDKMGILKGILIRALHQLPPESEARVKAEGYLRNSDWPRLYSWATALKDTEYPSAYSHFIGKQLAALVLKYPVQHTVFGLEKSARETAIDTFMQMEARCARTNVRFSKRSSLWRSRFFPLLEEMRLFCHKVFEGVNLETPATAQCDFGSGSNVGCHGSTTSFARKLSADAITGSGLAFPYFVRHMWANAHYREYYLRSVQQREIPSLDLWDFVSKMGCHYHDTAWNKIDFVPKTAKTDRSIAIEPTANTFLQKGVDLKLRGILRRWGYDLSDQSRNQRFAREGSINGRYATMDLSSASDTMSRGLLYYLLPGHVFDYLNRVRSTSYNLDGHIAPYHKFVSMGNGFCFPLETLVFASACRAVMRARYGKVLDHCVYGDDIIVPNDCFDQLSSLLKFCGFLPNPAKSFNKGPFRESCGADWYHGLDVRPVELDTELLREVDLMIVHNSMLRSEWTTEFFAETCEWLRSLVPEQRRYVAPKRIYGKLVQVELDGNTVLGKLFRPERRNLFGHKPSRVETLNANGAFHVAQDVFMQGCYTGWSSETQSWTWRELRHTAQEDELQELPPLVREFAGFLALLRGSPGGRVTMRFTTKVRSVLIGAEDPRGK